MRACERRLISADYIKRIPRSSARRRNHA